MKRCGGSLICKETRSSSRSGRTRMPGLERKEALAIVDDLISHKKAAGKVADYFIAIACAGLGDRDQALMWLENAYQKKGEGIVFMDNEELLDSIRATPRFREMISNMAFPR